MSKINAHGWNFHYNYPVEDAPSGWSVVHLTTRAFLCATRRPLGVLLAVLGLGTRPAVAQSRTAVSADCPLLQADQERLASFEARAFAELALRNRSPLTVRVVCQDRTATVRVQAVTGRARERRLTLDRDPWRAVDELLATIWELAPEPRVRTAAAGPPPVSAPPAAGGIAPLLLGRLRATAWSGTHRGLWGPELSAGFRVYELNVALGLGFRRSFEAAETPRLEELASSLTASTGLLGPLELSVAGYAWRLRAFSADAPPEQHIAWGASGVASLQISGRHGNFEVAAGPQLELRVPRVRLRVDGRAAGGVPWLTAGAAVEVRFCPE